MRKLVLALLGALFVVFSNAQYLTNLNYSLSFGDLEGISVPYNASTSTKKGNFLYHATYSHSSSLGNFLLIKNIM
ncbi:MAG: hypothetical protein JXQ87_14435 [Bacteroidia bacterium]